MLSIIYSSFENTTSNNDRVVPSLECEQKDLQIDDYQMVNGNQDEEELSGWSGNSCFG